ncbi:MAG: MBL fold metallo-hydrolase, partial [Prevotella sp.]|nr:MBL fold metallo-hydrolase [Prevotella sp.]
MKITDKIHYVGVNDRNKSLFEGLWPLPNGVSYNSYLIDDEKICLIDTVEADFFTQYLENIREIIGERPVDYLVVNHMEPDHSGSIALLRKYYPEMQVVGNKKTFGMMQGFYGEQNSRDIEVANGSQLSLGSVMLDFVLTPMVHWPETMMTLVAPSNLPQKGEAPTITTTSPQLGGQRGAILFSGDAFGCFGALNGAVIDKDMNCEDYWLEMVRYYSNIVGKY